MRELIEKQTAIDAINRHFGFNIEEEYGGAVQEIINGLPSAQPERKMGHWEDVPHKSVEHGEVAVDGETVRCSVCRHAEKGWNKGMNYCPECGADMRGEQNE